MRQIVGASGSVLATKSYEPYGSVLTSTGTASSIFAYAGEQIDTMGLMYLRARYLNPRLGIFLARDPWSGDVMRPGSMNGWNYVSGDPINFTDPTGMQKEAVLCQLNPQFCQALIALVEAGGAVLTGVEAGGVVVITIIGGGVVYAIFSPQQKMWPPPPSEAPAPPRTDPKIDPSRIPPYYPPPQLRTAKDIARDGGWTGRSSPAPEPQRPPEPQPNPWRGPIDPGPWVTCTPTSTREPSIRVRHYSRVIEMIRTAMAINSPNGLAIWGEYPVTTPYEEKAIQRTTDSFKRPLNRMGGFVEFNVDLNKWQVEPDPNLIGNITGDTNPVWIRPKPIGIMTGFPLSDVGVNPQFYNWKGQPLE